MRYIDADALIQDFDNDVHCLRLGGMKGTRRPLDISLKNVIERIEDATTEDVVPRAEVEKFIQEIDQIQKDKAEITYLKEQLIAKAKQEVASTIIEHFISKKESLRQEKFHQEDIEDFFLRPLELWDYIDNFVGLTGEEILAELNIGE